MCNATLGATPVYRCTWAASAIFSSGVRGTPGWAKTLNRVPELPNAQDGVSMRWAARARLTAARSVMSITFCWKESAGGPKCVRHLGPPGLVPLHVLRDPVGTDLEL